MTGAHAAYSAWENDEGVLAGAPVELLRPDGMKAGESQDAAAAIARTAISSGLHADPARRDQIILDELPQVHFIAARLLERLPPGVQMEDLVQAGVLGLLEAYDNYDHARNAQFRTFARFRIRGAILDSLRALDWGSRGARRRAREIAEAAKRLESELGRAPEREEVAAALGMSLEALEAARSEIDGLQIVGQQQVVAGDLDETLDLIESARSAWENPFELYARAEQKQVLAEAIGNLTEREQTVLSLYYREELTMKEVAEVVGVAVSRVSQLHAAALTKLRRALEADSVAQAAPTAGAILAGAGQLATGQLVPGSVAR